MQAPGGHAFSIERSFLDVRRILLREWRLLVPVALAFMALPPLAVDLLMPDSVRQGLMRAVQAGDAAPVMAAANWLLPISLLIFLLNALGGLAVTILAVVPRISVREAIVLAVRRLPVLAGVFVLLIAALFALLLVLILLLAFLGLPPATAQTVLMMLAAVLGAVAGVRLSVANAVIATRRVGPLVVLRESWAMTRGRSWRIFAALAVYLLGATVVIIALRTAVGAVLLIAGRALGAGELAIAVEAVLLRVLAAAVATGIHLLGASFFRQIEGSRGT